MSVPSYGHRWLDGADWDEVAEQLQPPWDGVEHRPTGLVLERGRGLVAFDSATPSPSTQRSR